MKRYLIFAIVGPFLGGLVLLLATTYQSGYWTETDPAEVAKFFAVFFKSLQYNYLFGLLPALLIGAVEDILFHVRRIGLALRIGLVGAIAFVVAAVLYGSRGSDSGVVQFILYGMVGLIPAVLSTWLVHRFVEEPRPAHAS
jgi:uncharacterized membrane protein YuzA (DUF378 family)